MWDVGSLGLLLGIRYLACCFRPKCSGGFVLSITNSIILILYLREHSSIMTDLMAQDVSAGKAAAEALIPQFKVQRMLNQGMHFVDHDSRELD